MSPKAVRQESALRESLINTRLPETSAKIEMPHAPRSLRYRAKSQTLGSIMRALA